MLIYLIQFSCQHLLFIQCVRLVLSVYRMIATMTKLGEGAFADVFGCQKEGWDKLAIKVSVRTCSLVVDSEKYLSV